MVLGNMDCFNQKSETSPYLTPYTKVNSKYKLKPQWDIISPYNCGWYQKNENNICWWGYGKKGTPIHWWWECTLGAAFIINVTDIP